MCVWRFSNWMDSSYLQTWELGGKKICREEAIKSFHLDIENLKWALVIQVEVYDIRGQLRGEIYVENNFGDGQNKDGA